LFCVNRFKPDKFNTTMLLFLTVTYLFIAVSNIFYLPPIGQSIAKKPVVANSILKRCSADRNQPESPTLKRPDKSTFEEKKKVLADISPDNTSKIG